MMMINMVRKDGADVKSGGGGGAEHNLHSTDFEHRHQEEPAQAGMVRLLFDGDGRYLLVIGDPRCFTDNALAVLTSDGDNNANTFKPIGNMAAMIR